MIRRAALCCLPVLFAACAAPIEQSGTLAELERVEPDVEEVYLADSLERAADSYRRYLTETEESELTPEAMRRLADLQLEREYGVIVGAPKDMAAPESAGPRAVASTAASSSGIAGSTAESDRDFEARASERQALIGETDASFAALPDADMTVLPSGPLEAVQTYQRILEQYPHYERNDQVLYQMSRAYDELGQTDDAMAVMNRLVTEFPDSRFIDEVYFRRGEYYFVRKRYLDAEDSYGAITAMGESSSYYELALYKLGWTLYKQELYEEALHKYMAMLDYREATGFDFDSVDEGDEEHRVTDTFRVISLSFSNLGDAGEVNRYFATYGHRPYGDKIYSNLGEFYFDKLRYEDAASVYKSFIGLNPTHGRSPYFNMRVIEIYTEAAFPQLVVEAKKEFAETYALDANYWTVNDVSAATEVVGFLKSNLTDLANHYHALYQDEVLVDDHPGYFAEARRWYGQIIDSFPQDPDTPGINYQLADLYLQNEDFGLAALEYERTAYGYADHERAPGAGYAAVYAHREHLKVVDEVREPEVLQATVDSSLTFADTFPDHEQADVVLGAAADDLYGMQQFDAAIAAASKLIERYPGSDTGLRRAAWTVIGHSSIDIEAYPEAEHAYIEVLALTDAGAEDREAIVDALAASIYKQGEQAIAAGDVRAGADHYLRIKDVAPGSAIRTAAEYDAAAALITLSDWTLAAGVLEAFRSEFPEHELNREATKQLAYVYREDGQTERSAGEYERISAEADDPVLAREAMLTAGELYDEAESMDNAVRVYEQYVAHYPEPLDFALETRSRLSQIFDEQGRVDRYYEELREIIALDAGAGDARSDRSRYLAGKAALVLAEIDFRLFAEVRLTLPFEDSLLLKQQRMETALAGFEALVDYEVAEVTAAATYYLGEIYFGFSRSLIESERPEGLSAADSLDYDLALEEEAYPFEERGIEVHGANYELLMSGIYNDWIVKSLEKLAVVMPARYAKSEISSGYVGEIDVYAYRMPIAPEPVEEGVTARVSDPANGGN